MSLNCQFSHIFDGTFKGLGNQCKTHFKEQISLNFICKFEHIFHPFCMSINTSLQKDDIDINLLHPEWKMGFLGQEIVDQTPNYDKSSVSIGLGN